MKKTKFLLIVAAVFFNGFFIMNVKKTSAEGTPTQKGVLGNYQGLYICHCPDDTANCWCNSILE